MVEQALMVQTVQREKMGAPLYPMLMVKEGQTAETEAMEEMAD